MMGETGLSRAAINRLTANTEPFMGCDECFEELDTAIEQLLDMGLPLAEGFRVHMNACPACHEEARCLAELISPEYQLSPSDAVARLDAATLTPEDSPPR